MDLISGGMMIHTILITKIITKISLVNGSDHRFRVDENVCIVVWELTGSIPRVAIEIFAEA